MGPMMKSPGVAKGAATGAFVTAGSSAGKSVIRKFFTHPLVLFGLGVAAGYYIHKYRKSIISSAEEEQEEDAPVLSAAARTLELFAGSLEQLPELSP
ncbi:MAG: hypothetical protein QHI38_09660 [Armatimonadota bacterium]|nr:hypothetical protein [Armatimonadota bacterium]